MILTPELVVFAESGYHYSRIIDTRKTSGRGRGLYYRRLATNPFQIFHPVRSYHIPTMVTDSDGRETNGRVFNATLHRQDRCSPALEYLVECVRLTGCGSMFLHMLSFGCLSFPLSWFSVDLPHVLLTLRAYVSILMPCVQPHISYSRCICISLLRYS